MLRQTPQILLVEEDPLLSEITAFRLELLGYEVVKVTTAELAIDFLQHDLPTLMIVDQTLPKMGGIFDGNFNVAFVDGSVRHVLKGVKEETLKKYITIAGNETPDPKDLEP